MLRARIIGGGRAGSAFASALAETGWEVVGVLGRDDDPAEAANDVDLVLVTTPDAAVESVARAVTPDSSTVVAHVAGSLDLGVLAPHEHRASLHPLIPLPHGPVGARGLRGGGWFAVAGSTERAQSMVGGVVEALGGRVVAVDDRDRVAYHAAACMASNHVVALMGQVERIASSAGVPLAAYLDLVQATIAAVGDLGPAAALTGPVARADWGTVTRHLAAIDPSERAAYVALAAQARRLVEPAFDPDGPIPPATQG